MSEENKKKVSDRIKEVLAEAIIFEEKRGIDNNIEILPENVITFTPLNTYKEIKKLMDNYFELEKTEKTEELLEKYFDTRTKEVEEIKKKKETIINNLHLNDLKCDFIINDKKYTFTFMEDKIYMLNNSTREELETDYNLDICSLMFEYINNENSIIYKKNKNGLSIISLMLRNNINKGTEEGSLCYALQRYINNNSKDKINKLFITTVCEAGNIDIFKYLFLNYKKLFDKNMLDAACFGKNTEIIRVLIQEGYEINFNTLKAAFAGNDINIVEFLLDNYYNNFNFDNIYNLTDLFKVIKNPEIGFYFINNFIHKLSKNIENDQRQFSLILNKMRKYNDKVANFKPIVINGKIQTDDKFKLVYFNRLKKYNETRKYEEMDKNKLIEVYLYSTFFLRIVGENNLEMFCFFIKEIKENLIKIDVNIEDDWTPLHHAVYNGNIDIINALLLFEDIKLNLNNNAGSRTPLHYATENCNLEVIKILLSHKKVKVNLSDYSGCTPLHYAARNENPEVIKAFLLSNKDIKVNKKNNNGCTPLHYAAKNENPEVIKALLLHKDIDVNIKDNNGCTPLYYATKNENPEVIKALLLHKDIDVNIRDNHGYTPLYYAAKNENPEIIKALLSYKEDIDVNIMYNNEDTLLHIAASYKKNPEIVKALIANKNIDINAENKDGFTPLQVAASCKNIEVIKVLLSCDNIKINNSLMRQLRRYPEVKEELKIYIDKQEKLKNQNTNNTFMGAINGINNITAQQNKGTFNSMGGGGK